MKILDVIDGIGEVIISSAEKVYRAIPKRGKRERDKRIAVVKEELAELKEMEEGKEIEEEAEGIEKLEKEEEVEERPSVVKVEKAEEEISEEELEEEMRREEVLEREVIEKKKEREEEEEKIREEISTIEGSHVVVDTGEGTVVRRPIVRHDLKGPFLTRFKKFIKLKKTKK